MRRGLGLETTRMRDHCKGQILEILGIQIFGVNSPLVLELLSSYAFQI